MVDYDTTITTRITEETKERIEEYAERNGISTAGAQRQLLYKGMRVEDVGKREKYPTTRPARIIGGMIMSPVILMIVLSDAGLLPPTKAIAYGVGIGIGLVLLSVPIEEYIGSGESPS
jgi:hypothetical protein